MNDAVTLQKVHYPLTPSVAHLMEHSMYQTEEFECMKTVPLEDLLSKVFQPYKKLKFEEGDSVANSKRVFLLYFPEDPVFAKWFLTCDICFEQVDQLHRASHCCKGNVCLNCLQQYLRVKIEEKTAQIKCPVCKKEMEFEDIMRVVDDALRDEYQDVLFQKVLRDMPNYCHCPMPNCKGGGVFEPNQSFVVCDSCGSSICPHCHEEFHFSVTCKARKEWKLVNNTAEAETEQWKRKKSKNCPECKSPIEKTVGCDHMTCSVCRYEFCWQCMEKYYDGHIREKHQQTSSVQVVIQTSFVQTSTSQLIDALRQRRMPMQANKSVR